MTTKNLTVAVNVTGNASSLNAALTGSQSKSAQLGAQLATLKSPAGQQAMIANMRFTREIGNLTSRLQRVADHGRLGARLMDMRDRFAPLTSAAQRGAAVAAGAVAAGVASLPDLSSQLSNSFAMLSREVGISVTPAMVRFSGLLQSLSRTVRAADEATGGLAGDALGIGALGVGALAAGRALGLMPLLMNPLGLALAAGAVVAGGGAAAGYYGVPWLLRETLPGVAQTGLGQQLMNRPGPIGGFFSGLFGGAMGYSGAGAGAAPSLQIDRQPQVGDLTSLYDQILMGAVGKTPEQAEQESRALEKLIASIDALKDTIDAANPPQPP